MLTAPGAGREKNTASPWSDSSDNPMSEPQNTRDCCMYGVYMKKIEPENELLIGFLPVDVSLRSPAVSILLVRARFRSSLTLICTLHRTGV